LNSAENRLRVLMVDHPLHPRIHLSRLCQEVGPPLSLRFFIDDECPICRQPVKFGEIELHPNSPDFAVYNYHCIDCGPVTAKTYSTSFGKPEFAAAHQARARLPVALSVLLRSAHRSQTNFPRPPFTCIPWTHLKAPTVEDTQRKPWIEHLVPQLQRPMHPAEQPADAEGHGCRSVRLRFDRRSKPLLEASSSLASGVGSLPVQVLGSPTHLIDLALNLSFGIADQLAGTFFDFATDIPSCAGYAVLIHGDAPPDPDDRSCDLSSISERSLVVKVPDEWLMCGFGRNCS
jgi:hypothetical protein